LSKAEKIKQAQIMREANKPVSCCGHPKASHGDYGECGHCMGEDGPCQGWDYDE
jgi:hypothetical protein